MPSIFDAYFGVAKETVYGTAVAPTRFYEFTKEGFAGVYERIESAGIRSGTRVLREDRFVPNPKGAAGDIEFEVFDLGMGFWLEHMLGAVATSGAAAPFTHTGTIGELQGKSFTAQVNRPDRSGSNQVFTYEGGKVAEWELSNSRDGLLMLALTCDFEKETIGAGNGAYALVSPSYPANARLLSFVGGSCTVAGTQFAISEASVKGTNSLDNERFLMTVAGSNTDKREPLENGVREIEFELKGEFENLAHSQRVAAATAAGAVANIVLKWQTPNDASNLTVTIPAGRFDDAPVNLEAPGGLLEQTVTGKGLHPVNNASAVTVALKTADSTP